MKKFNSHVLAIAAVVALFLIGSLIRSRDSQAKGAYSTPVMVMNTSSAPAINSTIDDPGRIPYNSMQQKTVSSPLDFQEFTFPPVPVNHRLVVTQIGGVLGMTSNSAAIWVQLTGPGGAPGVSITPQPTSASASNIFTAPITYYFDPGQSPFVTTASNGNNLFIGNQSLRLIGYMLDCSAAPCAPIAQ